MYPGVGPIRAHRESDVYRLKANLERGSGREAYWDLGASRLQDLSDDTGDSKGYTADLVGQLVEILKVPSFYS